MQQTVGRDLEVRVLRAGAEVELIGRLDGRTAPLVREVLHGCVDEGQDDLLVHVGSLELWDSAGLGVLVGAQRRARRAGRRLVLTDVPPRHVRLLRATKLHRVFVVEPLVA
jgi:anti-sigma B factor antagonist